MADLGTLHSRLVHFGGHHRINSCARSLAADILGLEHLLILDPLKVLLIFNLLLHVLVSLEELIMLIFSQLQSLIQVALQLLLKSVHLILLLLDEFGFGGNDLLVSLLHVLFSLSDFQILAHHLNLMGLSVLLLLGETLLNSLLIQQF